MAPIPTSAPGTPQPRLLRTADGKSVRDIHSHVFCFSSGDFCSGLLDNLNKHFQNSLKISNFNLDLFKTPLHGYFLMAPGRVHRPRFGQGRNYQGLVLAAPAPFGSSRRPKSILFGLFGGAVILATGLACLETIATRTPPCWAGGKRRHRINIAKSQRLGWISACSRQPLIPRPPMKSTPAMETAGTLPRIASRNGAAGRVHLSKVPDLRAEEDSKPEAEGRRPKADFKRSHSPWRAGQFLYVAPRRDFFSFFINYSVSNLPKLTDQDGGNLQTIALSCSPAAVGGQRGREFRQAATGAGGKR